MSVLAYVVASDDRVFDRLLAWRPPRGVRVWMLWASRFGDGWAWPVTAALLAAGGRRGLLVLGAGLVAAGLANAFLVVTKSRVRRSRPCERARPSAFDVRPLTWFPSDRFSFPSGHALNAFAVGTLVALAFPSFGIPVLAAAVSVAASRVVLGLHWLSDVVAGAFAGLLIGFCAWLLLLR